MTSATERCNCDASCGENRYHDVGDPGCRFSNLDEYEAYWDARRIPSMRKGNAMANTTKISDKLTKVSENFTINMYDNGFMVEIGGKDKKDDWKTAKIMVNTVDELLALVREATQIERDS